MLSTWIPYTDNVFHFEMVKAKKTSLTSSANSHSLFRVLTIGILTFISLFCFDHFIVRWPRNDEIQENSNVIANKGRIGSIQSIQELVSPLQSSSKSVLMEPKLKSAKIFAELPSKSSSKDIKYPFETKSTSSLRQQILSDSKEAVNSSPTIQQEHVFPQRVVDNIDPLPRSKVPEKDNSDPSQTTTNHEKLGTESAIAASQSLTSEGSSNIYHRGLPPFLGLTWDQFLQLPNQRAFSEFHQTKSDSSSASTTATASPSDVDLITCPIEVEKRLQKPQLTREQSDWCQWALKSDGGAVVVGKSWGKLNDKNLQSRFDNWNCNLIAKSGTTSPSCDAAWGDEYIYKWRNSPSKSTAMSCKNDRSSLVRCIDNYRGDRQCVFDNVQINFGMQKTVPRPGLDTNTKKFEKGFLSVDCDDNKKSDYIKFHYLYSTQLQSRKCDYVINGTVLLFSHDDIRNLAHTMNDIMNVWQLLWLYQLAGRTKDITFLNVDSFALGYNFADTIDSDFFTAYKHTFPHVLSGYPFAQQKAVVCIQQVLMQPSPPTLYTWDSWSFDNDCTFRGPSALFQRFNLDVRKRLKNTLSLIGTENSTLFDSKMLILIIFRKQLRNNWGHERTTRNTLNIAAVTTALEQQLAQNHPYAELKAVYFEDLKFDEQLKLVTSASLVIGMHGAGIAHGLHMSIGRKNCCGVLEIFPNGHFTPIKGFGNMLRRMGVRYDRLDISKEASTDNGAEIPANELGDKVITMLNLLRKSPTCVLRKVISDPYLDSYEL